LQTQSLKTWLLLGSLLLASTAFMPIANAAAEACNKSGSASARDERARSLFDQALELEAGAPQEALAKLVCADSLVDRPAVSLRIGIIAERLQELERALVAFERYLKLAGRHAPDSETITARIGALKEKLAEQDKAKQRAQRDDKRRMAGWVVAAVGGVTAIAGGGLLIAAKVHSDKVRSIEPGTTQWDSPEARETYEKAQREQTAGIASLVVGGVLTVTGLGLALAPRSSEPAGKTAAGRGVRGVPAGTIRARGARVVVRPAGATIIIPF
jgi:tetratricopeptide (TPR) repeat protein